MPYILIWNLDFEFGTETIRSVQFLCMESPKGKYISPVEPPRGVTSLFFMGCILEILRKVASARRARKGFCLPCFRNCPWGNLKSRGKVVKNIFDKCMVWGQSHTILKFSGTVPDGGSCPPTLKAGGGIIPANPPPPW